MTVIPSLRQLGCKLPIEIMYLGDEDLDEDMRDSLEELDGVVTRDLRLMIEDDGWHLAGMCYYHKFAKTFRLTSPKRLGRKSFRNPHVLLPRSDFH